MNSLLVRSGSREHAWAFARYATVGCLTLVTDLGVFRLLLVAHAPLPAVVSIAYAAAAVFQFACNKYFTFRDASKELGAQALAYVLVAFAMGAATLGMVEYGVTILHLQPLIAKICTLPITAIVGYVATRKIVFTRRNS